MHLTQIFDRALRRSVTRKRTPQDYAVEFGGYLANAAERLLTVHEETVRAEALIGADAVDYTVLGEARDSLSNAIYEFRKRAAKAQPNS